MATKRDTSSANVYRPHIPREIFPLAEQKCFILLVGTLKKYQILYNNKYSKNEIQITIINRIKSFLISEILKTNIFT